LSFFDDADEPETETEIRTPSRPRDTSRRRISGGGGGRGGGSGPVGGRPPTASQRQQEIRMRRIIAGVVVVIVIVLILIGVSSCQSSADKSAVESYTSNVNSLIKRSQNDSTQLFSALREGVSSSNATAVQNRVNKIAQDASGVVSSAQKQSVPSSVKVAQANLVQALQLRYDGINSVAREIQPAAGSAVTASAVSTIAGDMARFYASDVLYKLYAAPEIASALHGAGVDVGGADGQPISAAQFLPNLDWLTPTFISSTLGASGSGGGGSSASGPGPHGSELNSVSFNGNQLQPSGNTIAAKPPPSFTLNFTDSGASTERNVRCDVTVGGVSGQKVVPEVAAGQQASCTVPLSSSPPTGTATLKATVEKVPGEKNLSNNTLSFPVNFTG
jgi:hypothetical protein